jgi:carbon monoxide dehydrogenase subunit G
MLIEDKFIVKAPIERVWHYLLDPQTLASCIPGCEKIEAIDERTYDSIVGAKVGPISAKFKFRTTLVELEPPRRLKAVGGGEDLNKAGTFSQETVVYLKEVSKDEVEVSFRSDISITGRLTTFGDRILRAKAKQVGDEFTQALNDRLSGQDPVVSELKVSIWQVIAAFLSTVVIKVKKVAQRLIRPLKG